MIQIYFASISKGRDLLAEGGSMLTQVLRIVTFYFVCSIECTEDLVSDVGRIFSGLDLILHRYLGGFERGARAG